MANVSDISRIVSELIALVTTYLKEQTVVPLKRIVRYIGIGIAGSMFMGLGLFLVSLGFLRYLQTLEPFESTYSFVPYLLVIVADLAVVGILFSVIARQSLIKPKKVS